MQKKNPVTADFKIEDRFLNLSGDYEYFEIDTVTIGNVRFTALEDSAEYFWEIGAGVYTTKVVELYFPESTLWQTIPIKLTVTKEPDTVCFPNDPGQQILVKSMFVIDVCSGLYDGTFIGKRSDNQEEDYTIVIDLRKEHDTDTDCKEVYIENIDGKECAYLWDGQKAFGYRRLWLSESGIVCDAFRFLIVVKGRDSIYFDAVSVVNSEPYYWSFKGKRVKVG
ncbi:hypothetical protein QQ054_12330 [Oscillatoria amoena NRMC-F 0135]|nr:hypothetical protein [Oscillatoria amoena NRMC-F 0135]